MKITAIRKFQTKLLKRREKALREYNARAGYLLDFTRVRHDAEVITLDKVLDDLDRLIKSNHDRFHDRRKRKA